MDDGVSVSAIRAHDRRRIDEWLASLGPDDRVVGTLGAGIGQRAVSLVTDQAGEGT